MLTFFFASLENWCLEKWNWSGMKKRIELKSIPGKINKDNFNKSKKSI